MFKNMRNSFAIRWETSTFALSKFLNIKIMEMILSDILGYILYGAIYIFFAFAALYIPFYAFPFFFSKKPYWTRERRKFYLKEGRKAQEYERRKKYGR